MNPLLIKGGNMFHKLKSEDGVFYTTHPKKFIPNVLISEMDFKQAANFAYKMSFGKKGQHRDHRTGGSHRRKNGEIFANAFQGKLSEFAVYNYLRKIGLQLEPPDLTIASLGSWDVVDLSVNGKELTIKSTKSYGQMLLLETRDWAYNGAYKPNKSIYDYFILVRISPNVDKILMTKKLLYADEVSNDVLVPLIKGEKWKAEVSGYFTNDQFVSEVIKPRHIIPKSAFLNKTRMDAENYYIQIGDLQSLDNIKDQLQ